MEVAPWPAGLLSVVPAVVAPAVAGPAQLIGELMNRSMLQRTPERGDHVYEFRVEPSWGTGTSSEPAEAGEVLEQLQQLHQLATTLRDAGWPIWRTLTGPGFQAPDGCADADEVRRRLAGLGVTEPFEAGSGRTLAELEDAEEDLADRLWYSRLLTYLEVMKVDMVAERKRRPRGVEDVLQRMRALEERYGLDPGAEADPFLSFVLAGKLTALRWALGGGWNNLRRWSPSPLWHETADPAEAACAGAAAEEVR